MADARLPPIPLPYPGDDDYHIKVRLSNLALADMIDSGRWGWVIVRTVYTPESDEQFSTAVACIRQCFVDGFMGPWCKKIDQSLYDEVARRLDLPVIEDASCLDKASVATVREAFANWVKKRRDPPHDITSCNAPRFRYCIMLDERGLGEVMSAHALPKEKRRKGARAKCIKVVEWGGDEGGKTRQADDWRDSGIMKIPMVYAISAYDSLSSSNVMYNCISAYVDDERVPLSLEAVQEMQLTGIHLDIP